MSHTHSNPESAKSLDQKQIDFLENLSRPYLDADYLARRINGSNRHLRAYPEIKSQIADSLPSDDDQSILDTVEYISTARDIYNLEATKTPSSITILLDHLNLWKQVYSIEGIARNEEMLQRANAITTLSAIDLVSKIPEKDLFEYKYSANFLRYQLSTAHFNELGQDQASWYASEMEMIRMCIAERTHAIKYIDQLPCDENPEILSPDQIESDNKKIASIFKKALENRRYGVKVGYVAQKFNSGSFIFTNPPILDSKDVNKVHSLVCPDYSTTLATVFDSHLNSFSKKINKIKESDSMTTRYSYNIPSRQCFGIKNDGSISPMVFAASFEQLANNKGKYNSFRRIQAEILSDFIDLVTPIEVSKKAREIEHQDKNPFETSENDAADIVSRLLIPRIKAARINNDHIEKSEREHAPSDSKREIRLHDVVWHIRQLPEGWHASPEAIEIAKEAGIKLNEGETFVKPHTRGSKKMGEIAVHMLVNRPK